MTMPARRILFFLDEAKVREDHVDARVVLALGEGDAEIDHEPAARVRQADTIEIGVHADLAQAAEGQKDQFILVAGRLTFRLI